MATGGARRQTLRGGAPGTLPGAPSFSPFPFLHIRPPSKPPYSTPSSPPRERDGRARGRGRGSRSAESIEGAGGRGGAFDEDPQTTRLILYRFATLEATQGQIYSLLSQLP